MKYSNLKSAFGETPDSVKNCVRRSLAQAGRREKIMRKRLPVMVAAIIVLALIGCAGIAATNFEGIMQFFKTQGNEKAAPVVNEEVQEFIEPIDISHEGNGVKVVLHEMLYDANADTIALAWTIEARDAKDELYVSCEPRTSAGFIKSAHMNYVTDFMLKGSVVGVFSGNLPEDATDVILPFDIIRLKAGTQRVRSGDFEMEEAFDAHVRSLVEGGVLPQAGDGAFELYFMPGETDTEKLLATGLCELVDSFTLTVPLDESLSVSKVRTYAGESTIAFDGGQIVIHKLTATPTSVSIDLDYISDVGNTADFYIDVNPPAFENWCAGVSAVEKEPETLPDGRTKTAVTITASELLVFPDALEMRVLYYQDGTHVVSHASEVIHLPLTE